MKQDKQSGKCMQSLVDSLFKQLPSAIDFSLLLRNQELFIRNRNQETLTIQKPSLNIDQFLGELRERFPLSQGIQTKNTLCLREVIKFIFKTLGRQQKMNCRRLQINVSLVGTLDSFNFVNLKRIYIVFPKQSPSADSFNIEALSWLQIPHVEEIIFLEPEQYRNERNKQKYLCYQDTNTRKLSLKSFQKTNFKNLRILIIRGKSIDLTNFYRTRMVNNSRQQENSINQTTLQNTIAEELEMQQKYYSILSYRFGFQHLNEVSKFQVNKWSLFGSSFALKYIDRIFQHQIHCKNGKLVQAIKRKCM